MWYRCSELGIFEYTSSCISRCSILVMKCILAICIGLFWIGILSAQESIDTSLLLSEVLVDAWSIPEDSLDTDDPDIKDWLKQNTSIFLKDFGPGQLSSLSIRGASASQSGVYWSGVDIRNPMLGQIDMTQLAMAGRSSVRLLSSGLYDHDIHLGGVLDLKTIWQPGSPGMELAMKHYNYGFFVGSIAYQTNTSEFKTNTGLMILDASNQYAYRDYRRHIQTQTHAAQSAWSFHHAAERFLSDASSLRVNIWLRGQDSQIAGPKSGTRSMAGQSDNNYRLALSYQSDNTLLRRSTFAILHDRFYYRDSSIVLFDRSNSTVFDLRNRFNFWDAWASWDVGLDIRYSQANTDNYDAVQRRKSISLSSRLQRFWYDRFVTVLNVRQPYVDDRLLEPSFALHNQFYFESGSSLFLRAVRAIRLPNLNDLYWSPGGDPDLKTEKAWKIESGFRLQKSDKKAYFQLAGFSNWTSDWILWQPLQGSLWSPVNILKVWSRGFSQQLFVPMMLAGDQYLTLKAGHEYVRASYQNNTGSTDRSKGSQLIYTPKHKANINIKYQYPQWSFDTDIQYTSPVFITTDQSLSIGGYMLIDVRLSRNFGLGRFKARATLGAQNILNQDYQVVSNRPMPLRNYFLSINIHSQKD